jgi:hypothetical protein
VLIVVGLCAVALVSLALSAEGPARRLAPDEQIPERIVLHKHPKLGGQEFVTLTNREAVLELMTALPSRYSNPYCACFGYYQLDFLRLPIRRQQARL